MPASVNAIQNLCASSRKPKSSANIIPYPSNNVSNSSFPQPKVIAFRYSNALAVSLNHSEATVPSLFVMSIYTTKRVLISTFSPESKFKKSSICAFTLLIYDPIDPVASITNTISACLSTYNSFACTVIMFHGIYDTTRLKTSKTTAIFLFHFTLVTLPFLTAFIYAKEPDLFWLFASRIASILSEK